MKKLYMRKHGDNMKEDMFVEYEDNFKLRINNKNETFNVDSYHFHYWNEIYIGLKGICEFIVYDNKFEVGEGDAVIIPPNAPHYLIFKGESRRIDIEFTDEYLDKYFTGTARKILYNYEPPLLLHFNPETLKIIIEESKILDSAREREESERDLDFVHFAEILSCMRGASRICGEKILFPRGQKAVGKKTAEIARYIENHYAEIDSANDIADAFFMSRSHLSKIFREELGVPLIKYLNNFKIRKACEMLLKTDKSITDAALECGYSSSQYFSKVFKSITGETPYSYRKKYK